MAYKSGDSYQLNAKLREGMELSEPEQQIVNGLDTGLPKLPARKGTLYRNIQFDGFGDQEARDAFVAQHSEGVLVTYPSYTSTSTAEDGYPLEGEYVVHMVIEGETGRDVAGYGNNSESEVLFGREKTFEVSRVETAADGTPTIYMTEVDVNGETDQSGETGSGDHGGRRARGTEEGNAPGGNQPDLQPVREASAGSEVQRASDGNSESDPVQEAGVQEVPAEVTTKVTVDENGHPYIHVEEVQSDGEQNGVGLHSEERGMAVRGVQEAHSVHGDVQSAPERNSEGDHVRESNLQGSGDQVTEDPPEPITTEEQISEKSDLGN